MVGGVNGAAGYQYFLQLKQSQGAGTPANWFFNTASTNGSGSTSKDEFSVFQSALAGNPQGTQSSSQSDSTEFLVSLLQSAGQMGSANASTGATSSASQQNAIDKIFSQMDTNGDGKISKAEFGQAISKMHHHHHGGTGSNTQTDSSLLADQLFAQIDTNGDGMISKDELTAFQSSLTGLMQSGALSGTSTSSATDASNTINLTSLIQQAISKYLQLSPAGMVGSAALGGLLATG